MSPIAYLSFVAAVLIGSVLIFLDRDEVAFVTFFIGAIPVIFLYYPKPSLKIGLVQRSKNQYYSIENDGSAKASDIQYQFFGRLHLTEDVLITSLEPKEKREFVIGLSFETGHQLDVEVTYRAPFALSRTKRRIQTELIKL